MQNQVNKNDLSVYARLEDVEALLFADRKKFVAKALPYTDNKSTNPYTDYLPVTATVFVRDTEADSDGDYGSWCWKFWTTTVLLPSCNTTLLV